MAESERSQLPSRGLHENQDGGFWFRSFGVFQWIGENVDHPFSMPTSALTRQTISNQEGGFVRFHSNPIAHDWLVYSYTVRVTFPMVSYFFLLSQE